MLLLRKPSAEFVGRFVSRQALHHFTYSAIGATAAEPPAGYVVDHTRVGLGHGESVFATARTALRDWAQLRLTWLEAYSAPIQTGQVVATVARVFDVWWLNACRIVYVVDEVGPITRFGFAYGTLAGHVESGEERFLIEWDRQDNSVSYDILAFSRPRHLLARIGYPFVRHVQKRFAAESAAAMVRAAHRTIH